MIKTVWYSLRAIVYFAGLLIVCPVVFTTALILAPVVSYPFRVRILQLFTRFSVYWLKIICGVNYVVEGLENIPQDRSVILTPNHQSQFETLLLPSLKEPILISVAKLELIFVPFFGWGFILWGSIWIRRSKGRESLNRILKFGAQHLQRGHNIVIYPQGTRVKVGETGRFNRGAAILAIDQQVDLIPIAHNSGKCWIPGKLIKKPGTVTVRIGKPISPDTDDAAALTEELKTTLLEMMKNLPSAERKVNSN